ncbi:13390_t:CDS:2 [Acaulospora morrowiae]|uniref:13390_t:CDS:1 n=1 Tax=Acaulospora morrowiae TaxID=94023 RepID=A0A9N9CQX8_9GLOM|nr:13390_t:CDS:2 [Acaulospora morrowiae]
MEHTDDILSQSTMSSSSLASSVSFGVQSFSKLRPSSISTAPTSHSSFSSITPQSSKLDSSINIDSSQYHITNSASSSESELDVDFLCSTCKQPRKDDRWCQYCESQKLSMDFSNWTSGNPDLNEFIRDTQRRANSKTDYLVWIDYEMFEDVEFLAKGGFGDVYYAVWTNGPNKILVYDKEEHTWKITARTPVALKCLYDSKNISADFLNELKSHYKCRNGLILRCYGITQHRETRNYMLVMQYANGGDLRNYLCENLSLLTWGQKLRMLCDIALGLEGIHDVDLIHRDFHSGNILQHTFNDGTVKTFITDLGLCRPVNKFVASKEKLGKKMEDLRFWTHPKAVYTSRLLPIIKTSRKSGK